MKRAIVIGATSGIGRGLAECFAAQGYAVGLVGRRENLLKEIAQADPAAYRFAVADVTRPAETVAALEHLAQELGGMDLCVVCAGTGDLNPSLDFALEETAILTNVLGWTAAADWAYNRFERQGGGHLVVVSSVGGLRGGGAAPAYNASKAYQINYAEGLRQRAAKSRLPLYITDVRPGFVDTAMAKGDGLFWVMPVEKAVRQIVRAVRRRRRVAVVPPLAHCGVAAPAYARRNLPQNVMCMNGWFIAAGTLLIAAFFVHVVSGNRFYTAACPGRNAAADKAYEAWLMGRCGVQMITADLALGAVFLLLLGFGVIPRNFQLELFLLLTYGGWFLLWLVSLGYERAAKTRYLRLCHWALFLTVALLVLLGM